MKDVENVAPDRVAVGKGIVVSQEGCIAYIKKFVIDINVMKNAVKTVGRSKPENSQI